MDATFPHQLWLIEISMLYGLLFSIFSLTRFFQNLLYKNENVHKDKWTEMHFEKLNNYGNMGVEESVVLCCVNTAKKTRAEIQAQGTWLRWH